MKSSKPPAPEPTPEPAPMIDREAEAGRSRYALDLRKKRGRASTILAGASDLSGNSGNATLGGA